MNVLQTDYSNLFAAGLRVIESRSTGRACSPAFAVSSTASVRQTETEEDFMAPIEVASKKCSRFPANLWRHVSSRKEKSSSADASFLAGDAKPRLWRWRSMLPGSVGQDAPLDERIWDWSTSVYHATALPGEVEGDGEDYVDPYLEDKVDPVDTPLPTRATFLVALPSTAAPLWEHDFPVSLPSQHEQQHRRSPWSPQRRHPYSAPLKDSAACQWELASASSREESGIDDDWHQFRVEWIDFGVDGSR